MSWRGFISKKELLCEYTSQKTIPQMAGAVAVAAIRKMCRNGYRPGCVLKVEGGCNWVYSRFVNQTRRFPIPEELDPEEIAFTSW